jgi:hypothetical protein
MVRQCAWCLRLINSTGERLSSSPLPKLYEASHGICSACGIVWLTQATGASNIENSIYTTGETSHKVSTLGGNPGIDRKEHEEPVTQFILQLQRPNSQQLSAPKRKGHSRIVSGPL